MNDAVIEADGLQKSFKIDNRIVEVLKGIDVTLQAGETAVILGPSGAGKSTLLNLLGLLDTPTGGKVWFNGVDTATIRDSTLAAIRLEQVGFVFQFHHLLPEFTALENVLLPGLMLRREREELLGQAKSILNQVGLAERESHKPGELSGGEQQRVALARALINQPSIILADEPTGNLDRKASGMLQELLWSCCVENRAALILVTHNESFAKHASRVFTLEDGRLRRTVTEQ